MLFDFFEFQIWSCQKLSQRFFFFCFFLFIYIVFNQNYIITHEHSLLFKAQHINMHILFAKLIKETILYNPLPPLPPQKKEKLHPLPKSAANKVTVNYFHQ